MIYPIRQCYDFKQFHWVGLVHSQNFPTYGAQEDAAVFPDPDNLEENLPMHEAEIVTNANRRQCIVHRILDLYAQNGRLTFEQRCSFKEEGRPMPVFDFPDTDANRGRSFNFRDQYQKHEYFCGCSCEKSAGIFCFPCVLFRTGD